MNKLEELRKLFVEAVYEKAYGKDSYYKSKGRQLVEASKIGNKNIVNKLLINMINLLNELSLEYPKNIEML